MFCRQKLAQLRDIEPRIRDAGVQIRVIGNGQPWQAAALRDELALRIPLYVDSHLCAYRAAGLRRAWYRALDPRVLWRTAHAWRSGFRQTGVAGDPWQLGGTFLVDRAGSVAWKHVHAYPGDDVPLTALLDAAARVAVRCGPAVRPPPF